MRSTADPLPFGPGEWQGTLPNSTPPNASHRISDMSFTTTLTHDTYENVPLGNLSEKARGDIIENVVRNALEKIDCKKSEDPDAGTTITGKKRGRNSAPFDFLIDNRRKEVKSAQLRWDRCAKCWRAGFQHVKKEEYDDLYLALYTPSGIYIFKHDHKFGLSTHGKQQESSGGAVYVGAPVNAKSIEAATNIILEKMSSMFVKHISLDEISITTTVTHDIYKNVPLGNLSGKARGVVIEGMVRNVVERMTCQKSEDPDPGTNISGKKRGKNSAPFDFRIANRKKEVKSAQFRWDKSRKCWRADWQHIKSEEYDDLYLAMYTPHGIHIFEHDNKFGICTHGKKQESCGSIIGVMAAQRNEESIDIALKEVLEKMKPMYLQTIEF